MTVIAGGNGDLVAYVGEGTRPLVVATLDAYAAATADSAEFEASAGAREHRVAYCRQVSELRRQLDETSGPVVLAGPERVIVEVVRDSAVQATHELDSLLEQLSASPMQLEEAAIAELRMRTQAATACVEALIACESNRTST